jgi:hypothetical protein
MGPGEMIHIPSFTNINGEMTIGKKSEALEENLLQR